MEAFREVLDGWLTRTSTSQAELSRRSGVPQNVISRWLGSTPTRPSDANLRKLAPIVGVEYEDLLRMCGYLPGAPRLAQMDPIEAEIRARTEEMRDAVRDTPREFWAAIIKATFDRAIDIARDTAQLMSAAEDRALRASADEGPSGALDDASARRQRPIKPREPAFA